MTEYSSHHIISELFEKYPGGILDADILQSLYHEQFTSWEQASMALKDYRKSLYGTEVVYYVEGLRWYVKHTPQAERSIINLTFPPDTTCTRFSPMEEELVKLGNLFIVRSNTSLDYFFSPTEYRILSHLVESIGAHVHPDELINEVIHKQCSKKYSTKSDRANIRMQIKNIRRKLVMVPSRFKVTSKHGIGYRIGLEK